MTICLPHVDELALVVAELEDDRDDKAGDLGTDVFCASACPFLFDFGGSAAERPPVRLGTLKPNKNECQKF